MKRAYIICGLLKPDIDRILEDVKPEGDMIWMEAGLHSRPEHLKEVLQEKIDSLTGYDEICLTYALCGNALLGLTAGSCDIKYIHTDDCISAIMCDHPYLADLRRTSIFTNKSWLAASIADSDDISKTVEKYGEDRAKRIFKMMYGHYKNTCYMQTEDEIADEDIAAAKKMADRIETELIFEPASVNVYRCLFTGEAHRLIRTLKKGKTLSFADFFGQKSIET